MTEYWFDLRSGDSLVGVGAAAMRLDEAGPDVVPLPELITSKDFPVRNGDFPFLEIEDWQPGDYKTWGLWVLRVLEQAQEPEPLSLKHIERLRALGLGPSKARLGKLSVFKEAIGVPPDPLASRRAENGFFASPFSTWPTERFVKHAAAVAKKAGHRPRKADYQAAARDDRPGYSSILERFGSIAALNEYIGYPDYSTWDDEGFITYGTTFIAANNYDINMLVPVFFECPARRERGPWPRTPIRRFGSWQAYKDEVLDAFHAERQQKTERYKAMIAAGRLPQVFAGLPDPELDQVVARYLVIADYGRQMKVEAKIYMALHTPSHRLIRHLQRYNSALSPGDIELMAISHGVFNDVWPPAYAPHLQVSPEEREAALIKQRISRNRLRRRAHTTV